ncbi:hypothetical protein JCM1841_001130 [Sporobolomyces salmonicolor]
MSPPHLRPRALSASSAASAPLSPAYRLAEQYFSVADDMATYSTIKQHRIATIQTAQTAREQLARELARLTDEVARRPTDLGTRVRLLEVEGELKRAIPAEESAKAALSSPTILGPPAPRITGLGTPDSTSPVFPPSPPRTPSPSRLARSRAANRPLSAVLSSSTPRPPSPSSSSSSSRHRLVPFSPHLSISSPPLTAPNSDPFPLLHSFVPETLIVTSHSSIPSHLISRELGLVHARAGPSDLAGLKEALRSEGKRRGAHAVVGVETRSWTGECLVGVGRAVKLRRA